MAGHAGGNAELAVTAAIQRLATLHQRIVGDAGQRGLAGEIGADVVHVLIAECRGEAQHDRVLALLALEQAKLARDIRLVLAGELRVLLVGRIAVHAVAGAAYRRLRLAGLCVTEQGSGVRVDLRSFGDGRRRGGGFARRGLRQCRSCG
jgi:hypothetical protein